MGVYQFIMQVYAMHGKHEHDVDVIKYPRKMREYVKLCIRQGALS